MFRIKTFERKKDKRKGSHFTDAKRKVKIVHAHVMRSTLGS